MKSLVCDTGPLIALAKVDKLLLLPKLRSNIYIPTAVHRELLGKSGSERERLQEAFDAYLEIEQDITISPSVDIVTSHLDEGERQAIALAYNRDATMLIDERLGRQAAQRLGLTITGSAGLLLYAKKRNLISEVVPILIEMRQRGYWLSDALVKLVAQQANETLF